MGNSKSTLGLLLVVAIVAFALIGFVVLHHTPPAVAPLPMPADDSAQLQNAIDINIYVDGSGSIKHLLDKHGSFALKAGAGGDMTTNYLRDLLDKCESKLAHAPGEGGWNIVQVKTWKFGSSVTALPSEGGLRDLSDQPEQFHESHTYIEQPILHDPQASSTNARPELKIIITDLYQSGGAMEKPADVLATKYLKDDTSAVGILAIRNPFYGGVEDLPGMSDNQSIKDAADSMPFYVIFAGPAPDVRHAMNVIVQGTAIRDEFKPDNPAPGLRLFFSRSANPRVKTPPKITGKFFNLLAKDYNGTGISLVSLQKETITAKWADPPALNADGSLNLGAAYQLQPSVTVLPPRGSQPNIQAAVAAVSKCDDGSLACVKISRAGLQKGATYQYRFDDMGTVNDTLLPSSDKYELREWNIEKADAEKISAGSSVFQPDQQFRGHPGKTPDLSKFLTELQGQMFHTPVRVTSYYLDVQAN